MGNWFDTGLRRLIAPRRLLALAALAAVAGLVSDYVDVYNHADRTLALRQGPPPAVPVQNFDPRRHTGPAGEVLVHAEVPMDKAVVLPGAEGSSGPRYWVAPLYPLGDLGAALVTGNAETVGATVSAQVARRAPVGSDGVAAVGYLLWPLAPDAEPPRGAELLGATFGSGTMGDVVALNGEAAGDMPDPARIVAALGADGTGLPARPIAIAPYPMGRTAALAEIPRGMLGDWFYRLAVLLAAAAVFETLRRHLSVRRHKRRRLAGAGGHAASPDHPSFAPLTSQADIARAEAAEEEPAMGQIQAGLTALVQRFRSLR